MMNRELLPSPVQQDLLAGQMAVPMHARLGRLDGRRFPGAESLVAVDDALDSVPIKATNAGWDHYVF